jgi:hypothetical protein
MNLLKGQFGSISAAWRCIANKRASKLVFLLLWGGRKGGRVEGKQDVRDGLRKASDLFFTPSKQQEGEREMG